MPPQKRPRKAAGAKKAPRGNPAKPEEPKPSVDFEVDAGGYARWKIADEIYHLRPLTVGDYMELEMRQNSGAAEMLDEFGEAYAMPTGSSEQRVAKRDRLRKVNVANYAWVFSWWERLFTIAEVDGKPFPVVRLEEADGVRFDSPAPKWLFRPTAMNAVLGQLEGPPPPGVV
jgi:hypothetical protein